MKKRSLTAAAIAVALLLGSCGAKQSVIGGAIGTGAGAALGAGIGKVAGNTGLGAVIGAAVGGTAGALIGNKMDKQKKELEAALPDGTAIESVNEGEAIRVTFDSGILFNTNSSTLSSASTVALTEFAASLVKNLDTDIQIIGHTDSTGSDKINDPLSLKRAESVTNFLNKKGVASARLTTEGKGSREPIANNSTAEGRRQNRRVEIYILASAKMIQEAQKGTLK